jgi:hypothetical protein
MRVCPLGTGRVAGEEAMCAAGMVASSALPASCVRC